MTAKQFLNHQDTKTPSKALTHGLNQDVFAVLGALGGVPFENSDTEVLKGLVKKGFV